MSKKNEYNTMRCDVCKEEGRISSMNSMKAFDILEYHSIIMNRIGPHRDGKILIIPVWIGCRCCLFSNRSLPMRNTIIDRAVVQ